MRRFDGFRVMITGGGRGIGAATARRLAAEGASVLVTDLDPDRAARTAESVGGAAHRCDVADNTSVQAAVAFAVATFGGLEALVNNAYDCHPDPARFEDHDEADWARDLDVCLTGAYRCCRAAMPYLAAAGGRGAIVNVGSVNAERHFGGHTYSAAKAGLAGLTRTLAVESAPRGVRVNLVEPGTIRTPAWDDRPAVLERAAAHYPLGRVGEPEDVADAIAFLASPDARWITGVTLPVDGGLLVSNLGMNRAFDGGS
ncbi:SDR family NAD(P)-dependent oxidoreductase [Streptantibioticus silvisoli]|uniref:SDR family NAD(P)-dependent oxidoreductase n=1 Tax=Streptantibioticus silvisoli TaxID=2705255 RepID=A0ABT6W653_9ACTN|nr:SDR family NAD(P)-dependent oxidoreductase [Streptantibioticus silvisoli]MDI5966159.1 SDR family NAD(P)-dependent oxidoreductase [Streptantibioticus silvisoli]